jgi:killing trait domain-containing protein
VEVIMAGEGDEPKRGGKSPDDATGPNRGGSTNDALAQAVLGLSNLYTANGGEGVSSQVTDAVTQALVLILGSGPSLAAYDGLLQAQQANGIMYHNAVANQQKATMLGMAMTAKCVRYMMDPRCDALDGEILEEELDDL